MSENVPSESLGPLFFRTRRRLPDDQPDGTAAANALPGPDTPAPDATSLRAMDEGGMRQLILSMLAVLQRRPITEVAAGPLHDDGTIVLDSMTAVWVIATIGKAFGCKLVRLADVDPAALRSVSGLAALVRTAIGRLPALAGAA